MSKSDAEKLSKKDIVSSYVNVKKADSIRNHEVPISQYDLHTMELNSEVQSYQPSICCPECGSEKTWKDGKRKTKGREVQRYLCRSCGYRFSEPKVKLNVSRQLVEGSEPVNDLSHDGIAHLDLPLKESVDDLSFLNGKNVRSHKRTIIGQVLNILRDDSRTRQICVLERESKNLAKSRTAKE